MGCNCGNCIGCGIDSRLVLEGRKKMQPIAIIAIILNALVLWKNIRHFHTLSASLPPLTDSKLAVKTAINQWMSIYAASPVTVRNVGLIVINIISLVVI